MTEKTKIKKLTKKAEMDVVKKFGNYVYQDFITLRKNGKNPEPESFYESWIKANLTSKFPIKYLSTLWKTFIDLLIPNKIK